MTDPLCVKCGEPTDVPIDCPDCGRVYCPDCWEHHAITEQEKREDERSNPEPKEKHVETRVPKDNRRSRVRPSPM